MGFKLKGYRGQGMASSHIAIEGSDAANQMKDGTFMHHPAPKMTRPANMSHVEGHKDTPEAAAKAKAAGYDSFDAYFKATYPNVGDGPLPKEEDTTQAGAPLSVGLSTFSKGTYDYESVKANKTARTKEYNETPQGRVKASQISMYSLHNKKPLKDGPNKGKYLTYDSSGNSVYFTPDDYKKAADDYHSGLLEYAEPVNLAMKAKHGNVATFTDYDDGPMYGEAYNKLTKQSHEKTHKNK